MSFRTHKLRNKLTEAVVAVVPIILIVLVLCFSITPFTPSILLSFLMGAMLVIFGMMFFTLGAEMSMTMMGEKVGAKMTQSKNVLLIVCLSFLLGVMITISEPDLQVLATLVPSIPNMTIIMAVAIGVGIFLVLALLRILYSISLAKLLVFFYIIVFILASQVSPEFRAVAFDSGGVTTGPMTVPFIMALGIGSAAIRSDRNAADDSFGLVALCSVGPILAVLILGMIFHPSEGGVSITQIPQVNTTVELMQMFSHELPAYMEEIAVSLLPIIVFFGIFQVVSLRLPKRNLSKIIVGHWIGVVPDRCQCRLYAGGKLSGNSTRIRRLSLSADSNWSTDWLFYCKSRTGGLRVKSPGRRTYRRKNFCKSYGNGIVIRCICIGCSGNDSCTYRTADTLLFNSGLCHCPDLVIYSS